MQEEEKKGDHENKNNSEQNQNEINVCSKQHSEQRNNNVAMMTTTANQKKCTQSCTPLQQQKNCCISNQIAIMVLQILLVSSERCRLLCTCARTHTKGTACKRHRRTRENWERSQAQCIGFVLQQSVQHQGNTSINRQNTVESFRNVLRVCLCVFVCGKQECSLKSAKFDATISASA